MNSNAIRIFAIFFAAIVTSTFYSCRTEESSTVESNSSKKSHALDTPDQAMKVKESIESELLGKNDVNGVGITGCNPKTGALDIDHDFVYCVLIDVSSEKGLNLTTKQFPAGKKVDGVFITIKNVGVIKSQPRASSGN